MPRTGRNAAESGPFGLRLSEAERSDLTQLAQAVDRTPSHVVRRAIRFYRDHIDTVEAALLPRGEKADDEHPVTR